MTLLLGYDVGSSSVKATLLDAGTGKALAAATSPNQELEIIAKQPGWAEQHPDTWWQHVKLATEKIKAKVSFDPGDVKTIGISYQMHGLAAVDKNKGRLLDWGGGRGNVAHCASLRAQTLPPGAGSYVYRLAPPRRWEFRTVMRADNDTVSTAIADGGASIEMHFRGATIRIEVQELIDMALEDPAGQDMQLGSRSCFFAFDYAIEDNFKLLQWLQDYFDRSGLGIQVIAPANGLSGLDLLKDIQLKLRSVHFGVAEITGNNPNVMMETGILKGLDKPVILLKRRDACGEVPFDIDSDYRIEYVVEKRAGQTKFVWLREELDKVMRTVLDVSEELRNAAKWHDGPNHKSRPEQDTPNE